MAIHQIVIHENTGATKDAAPYLGSYFSKESVSLENFASTVGTKCGLPPIQVIAILGGAFEAFEQLEAESLVRIHTDLGVICGVITGSFPTADAGFNAERNSLELALRLDDSIRLELADVTAAIITDADVTRLRVDNVMDIEEERPMNLIHGQHVFRVAGFNMVLSDEGAEVFLMDANGTTYGVTVDEVVSKQLFKAHTTDLLEGGDYKLVVKSRAGDAAGPLQTSFRRVKYLKVVDPEPEVVITSVASADGSVLDPDKSPAVFSGENLGEVTGGTIHVKLDNADGTLGLEGDMTVTSATETEIMADWPTDTSYGSVWGDVTKCTFTFSIGDTPVSYVWNRG